MENPYLIGTKVYLRPLEKADAPLLTRWINDPEVTHTLNFYRPMNLRAEEEYIDRSLQSEHDLSLGIVVADGDQLIGATGLQQIDFKNRHAGFGLVIGVKGAWGKGYGTEATRLIVRHAFATLNLNRVWLHVFAYNERGIRIYEKVGFKKEGVLRQAQYAQGRYWDVWVMAVLRAEWDDLERQFR